MSRNPRLIEYHFGPFVLLPGERQVTKSGEAVTLAPRAFDVLLALIEHQGGLVPKRLLLDQVWPGLVVEDNTLQAVISTLRKLLGAEAISTVSKFGYRFNLPCVAIPAPGDAEAARSMHSFPMFQSSFVGRQSELAAVTRLLGRSRNVTLHGPGGAGKTRLATETALSLAGRFSGGAWFFDLSVLATSGMLVNRLAALLGLRETDGAGNIARVIQHVGDQLMLLVIDNAEHLVSEVASLVDGLLTECQHLIIMTTSRQPLGCLGESLFQIPALSLPDLVLQQSPTQLLTSDSFRLFVERARLQKPHLELNPDAAASVVRICHRLDGMPLPIELAASRVRSMSVEEIDQRLDQALRLLVARSSEGPRRHQTLRALIEWSYELLSDEERQVFCGISVFSGGFTVDLAEAVIESLGIAAWTVLEILETLVDKSLLSVTGAGAAIRYRQLETIRQYAEDRLLQSGQSVQWKTRHLECFARRAENANLRTTSTPERLREMDSEVDNIEAALATALEVDGFASMGLALSIELNRYWYNRGNLISARGWMIALLARIENHDLDRLRVKALHCISSFGLAMGEFTAAKGPLLETLGLARKTIDGLGVFQALHNFAWLSAAENDQERSLHAMRAEMRLLAGSTNYDVAGILAMLGSKQKPDYPETLRAEEFQPLAIDLAAQLESSAAHLKLAACLHNLGASLYRMEHLDKAEHVAIEAVSVAEIANDPSILAICRTELGCITQRLGKTEQSMQLHLSALQVFVANGEKLYICSTLESLARGYVSSGRPAKAVRVFGASGRLSKVLSYQPDEFDRVEQAPYIAAATLALGGEAEYQSCYQLGYDADLQDILDELLGRDHSQLKA